MKAVRKKKESVRNVYVFDIDDTICDTDFPFLELSYALSFFDSGVSMDEVRDRSYLHLSDCGFITEEEEDKLIRLMDVLHVWENIDIFPNVQNLLRLINSKGHYLVYLTKRPDHLRKQTEAWIQKMGLPQPVDPNKHDIYDLNQRVVLLTRGQSKTRGLKTVAEFHDDRDIYYFENDPDFVDVGCKLKIDNIFGFEYGYTKNVNFPKSVEVLKNPRDSGYEGIEQRLNL
jgi:hypothetical protein